MVHGDTMADLVAFLAVARGAQLHKSCGSMGRVTLGDHHTIWKLEERLAGWLLTRTSRSVSPT
jgi:DNA-binding transcriptional LysR family regulator